MDNFRRIDIDKYDEDVLLEEELIDVDQRSPEEVSSLAKQRAQDVRGLIGRGDAAGALSLVLSDPPYGDDAAGFKAAKDLTLSSLLEIINITKASDIAALVKSLSIDQQDVLMKYIYKGLASPELGASPVLLGWHDKLTEAAGTGCIVRVLTDRKRI